MSTVSGSLGTATLFTTLFALAAPAAGQEVAWRYDYEAARREAREKQRPLVIDFSTSDCFFRKKLDTITFRDAAVSSLLSKRFVAVKIDGDKDAPLAEALGIDSYPTLVFAAPDGKILGTHHGFVSAARFSEQLQRALRESGQDNESSLASQSAPGSADDAGELSDKARRARALLNQAKEDQRAQQYVDCLGRCRILAAGYGDLPEGAEAQRLAAEIKNDPERLRQACEKLTDAVGDTYLELADCWLRQNKPQQAAACLERAVQICPGTRQARAAQERLAQLRGAQPRQTDLPAPVVRGQSPQERPR